MRLQKSSGSELCRSIQEKMANITTEVLKVFSRSRFKVFVFAIVLPCMLEGLGLDKPFLFQKAPHCHLSKILNFLFNLRLPARRRLISSNLEKIREKGGNQLPILPAALCCVRLIRRWQQNECHCCDEQGN